MWPLDLRKRLERLGIREQDLQETYVKASGPGGQNVNKVSTCVCLCHRPSGIRVKCHQARTQEQNRVLARFTLCDKLDWRRAEERRRKIADREKMRRQKRKRSQAGKELMLEKKHQRSARKAERRHLSPWKIDDLSE